MPRPKRLATRWSLTLIRFYAQRRRLILAALTVGTVCQISACQEQTSLFLLRSAFSSISLPINQFLVAFFNAIAQASPLVLP